MSKNKMYMLLTLFFIHAFAQIGVGSNLSDLAQLQGGTSLFGEGEITSSANGSDIKVNGKIVYKNGEGVGVLGTHTCPSGVKYQLIEGNVILRFNNDDKVKVYARRSKFEVFAYLTLDIAKKSELVKKEESANNVFSESNIKVLTSEERQNKLSSYTIYLSREYMAILIFWLTVYGGNQKEQILKDVIFEQMMSSDVTTVNRHLIGIYKNWFHGDVNNMIAKAKTAPKSSFVRQISDLHPDMPAVELKGKLKEIWNAYVEVNVKEDHIEVVNTKALEAAKNLVAKRIDQPLATLEDLKNYKLATHSDLKDKEGINITIEIPQVDWLDKENNESSNNKIAYERLVKFGLVFAKLTCKPNVRASGSESGWEKAILSSSEELDTQECSNFIEKFVELTNKGNVTFNFEDAKPHTFGHQLNSYLSDQKQIEDIIKIEFITGSGKSSDDSHKTQESLIGSPKAKANSILYAYQGAERNTRYIFFKRPGQDSILNNQFAKMELEERSQQPVSAFSSPFGFFGDNLKRSFWGLTSSEDQFDLKSAPPQQASYTAFRAPAPTLNTKAIDVHMKAFRTVEQLDFKLRKVARDNISLKILKEAIVLGRALNKNIASSRSASLADLKFPIFVAKLENDQRIPNAVLKELGIGFPKDLNKLKLITTYKGISDSALSELGIERGDVIINSGYIKKCSGENPCSLIALSKPVE